MMKKLSGYCLLPAVISLIMLSCTQQPAPKTAIPVAKATAIMRPFHYHKMIEVAPGQDFDIMSWGAAHHGSLLILHSDSANNKFTTTTGDLEGAITDVFNSDMDTDGSPELLIATKAKDTVDYTAIYAYEFKNDDKANKLDFPKLTKTQKAGYRGNDNFYMRDGKLIREFPIYDGNTVAAKSTGQKRVLQYNLHNNTLTVKDLSSDTLKKSAAAIKADSVSKLAVVKKTVDKKPEIKKSKKEKAAPKHKKVVKKKKKHHRHRSE